MVTHRRTCAAAVSTRTELAAQALLPRPRPYGTPAPCTALALTTPSRRCAHKQAEWLPIPFTTCQAPLKVYTHCSSEEAAQKSHISPKASPEGNSPLPPIPTFPLPLHLHLCRGWVCVCVAPPMHACWPLVPCTGAGLFPNNVVWRELYPPVSGRETECSSGKTRDLSAQVTELVKQQGWIWELFVWHQTHSSTMPHSLKRPRGWGWGRRQGLWDSSVALWALHSEVLRQHFTKVKLIELPEDQELVTWSFLLVNSFP